CGGPAEVCAECYGIEPAEMAPGLYRSMTGNRALAWGVLAAAQRTGLPVVYGAYPITPASDVLHELSQHKRFRVRTIQAEDEIAAVGSVIGAAFGGAIGCCATSGPRLAPEAEGVAPAGLGQRAGGTFEPPRGGPPPGPPRQAPDGPPPPGPSPPETAGAGRWCWRPPHPATASSSRTRRSASPPSTWCRSSCSPTATWRTAPSRGSSPTRRRC